MKPRKTADYALVAAKGMAMGAADVVPGVSGGTIALLTGIYDELLHSLKQLGPEALLTLFKKGPRVFWQQINGTFLLVLFSGILLSIKAFAGVIAWCLEHYPLLVWGFFTGLIAASAILLWRQQGRWHVIEWVCFAIGVAIVVFISVARPAELPANNWILLAGGFIAIIAMILPGISGSFILLLLGLYPTLLAAVNQNDFAGLISFAIGAALGLMAFSRFLSWLLDNYHAGTLAVLLGFLVGSLAVTWPWKVVLESYTNRHGESVALVQNNVLPGEYLAANQADPMTISVLGMMLVGIFLVLFTEVLAKKLTKTHPKE